MSRQVTKLVKILMMQSEGLGLDARRDAQLNQCHFPSFLVKCSAFFLATGVNVFFLLFIFVLFLFFVLSVSLSVVSFFLCVCFYHYIYLFLFLLISYIVLQCTYFDIKAHCN